ncbi:MAG TPA: GDSL-type esterase/lipase family protein [Tepidisphaeraceae bacterium]|jgi:lysophospholipase L1-like esterase
MRLSLRGDSITEKMPWAEFFTPIRNRGIGAEASDGLLRRFDDILKSRPRQVFINIGTNDLNFDYQPEFVIENVRAMLEKIRQDSPQTEAFICSVLPINLPILLEEPGANPVFLKKKANNLPILNAQLRALAEQNHIPFLDLWPRFADGSGQLHTDLTVDGTHLTIEGKIRYVEAIRSYVKLASDNLAVVTENIAG